MTMANVLPRRLAKEASYLLPLVNLEHRPDPATSAQAENPSRADRAVHPAAIGVGLAGVGLLFTASLFGWATGPTVIPLGVIFVFSALYFGLLAGMGHHAASVRDAGPHRSFRQFLAGRVATLTGEVTGRQALFQIAFLPCLLGLLMTYCALLWSAVR